jgi:hypothetical protein
VLAAVALPNEPPGPVHAKPAAALLAAALTSMLAPTLVCSGPMNTEVICGQLTTSPLMMMLPRFETPAPHWRPTPTPTVAPTSTVKGLLVPEQTSTPSLKAVSSIV